MERSLAFIGLILIAMLLFKDMSGEYELVQIREELNRIAKHLEDIKKK